MRTSLLARSRHSVAGGITAASVALAAFALAAPSAEATETNHLAGQSYAAGVAAASSYPDSGDELTDGAYASTMLADNAWQGRWNPGTYSFTAELDGEQSLSTFTANFYKYTGAGVHLPTEVRFETSPDGNSWATACTVNEQTTAQDITTMTYGCSPQSPHEAAWVKVTITNAASTWSFIDEWEALGPENEPELCDQSPRFSGTFLQPDLADTWSPSDWEDEFDYLLEACMTELVLQWTADSKEQTTIYPSSLSGYTQSTTNDIVGRALSAADSANAEVYLGLQVNDDWWQTYASDSEWLDDEAATAQDLADDLWTEYGNHDSLAGWYLSFEVDNWNFTTQASWDNMADFYDSVASHLHTLTPGKPVVISPFYNVAGGLTTSQWTNMWTSILSDSSIDVIALQDGVGAGHATTGQLAAWFAATESAIAAAETDTELWADTETFNLNFQPMWIGDVVANMEAVQPYVERYWSFSYNHYQSPQQVIPVFHQTYLDYLDIGSVESSPPTAPTSLDAEALDPLTIELSWTAATDDTGVAGYRIYRNSALVKTLTGTATTFTDYSLDPGTSYVYAVEAFDGAGNVSQPSSTSSESTPSAPTYPTNLASGKSYTATIAPDGAYPDNGGELTDGSFGTTDYQHAAWQGRNTGSPYSFTIDLGSTQTIGEINSSWLQVKSVFIFLPAHVIYEVSTNGSSFTQVGTVPAPAVSDADQSRMYRLIDVDEPARYIRVTAQPFSSAWSFVDEIEVRAD